MPSIHSIHYNHIGEVGKEALRAAKQKTGIFILMHRELLLILWSIYVQ